MVEFDDSLSWLILMVVYGLQLWNMMRSLLLILGNINEQCELELCFCNRWGYLGMMIRHGKTSGYTHRGKGASTHFNGPEVYQSVVRGIWLPADIGLERQLFAMLCFHQPSMGHYKLSLDKLVIINYQLTGM